MISRLLSIVWMLLVEDRCAGCILFQGNESELSNHWPDRFFHLICDCILDLVAIYIILYDRYSSQLDYEETDNWNVPHSAMSVKLMPATS